MPFIPRWVFWGHCARAPALHRRRKAGKRSNRRWQRSSESYRERRTSRPGRRRAGVGAHRARPGSRPPDPPAPRIVAATVAPDTVRVSTQKLGAILLEAEELVGAKIAGSGRAAELRALAADLANWNQQCVRQASRQRRGQEGTAAASELLESEMLYTRTLENSLRKLAGSAHQDALSLAAITDRLLEDTKKVLLLPCSYLLGALPKVVRDLAREQGKEADLARERGGHRDRSPGARRAQGPAHPPAAQLRRSRHREAGRTP